MRLARFFIDRPVFAAVRSIAITLVGAIAAFRLPIAEYPDIAPPTAQVTASYPGASAETIAQTVAGPIEQEVNGVDGMLYLSSRSTGDGRLAISVVFRQGTNVDQAPVLVQNRVAIAEPRRPEEVRRLGLTVKKALPDRPTVVHGLVFTPVFHVVARARPCRLMREAVRHDASLAISPHDSRHHRWYRNDRPGASRAIGDRSGWRAALLFHDPPARQALLPARPRWR